jgi:SAM-dependent methyltransferase
MEDFMTEINIIDKWCADLYDKEETETDDVEFLLSVIGEDPQNILEAACGSGRILVPIAKAGHTAVGFDMDESMLERIPEKAKGLNNISYSKADAIDGDWGSGFDTVVLAGNVLINIVSAIGNKEAQRLFIKRAYDCLKPNGHIYIDFNCFSYPEKFFGFPGERVVFEGIDSSGNYGKQTLSDNKYDIQTEMATFKRRTEITTKNGEKVSRESSGIKHIPTLQQVHEWLDEVGFKIVNEYGDYKGNPISESTYRAIIWAEKID